MTDKRFILMSTPFRSGSALISRILNSHSHIGLTADKVKFFRYCYNRFLPLNEKNILKMLDELSRRLSARFEIDLDIQACYETLPKPANHASIYSAIFQYLYRNIEKPIIGEMENLAWTKIPIFLNMFPNGKALLIIRDLRDVVVSFKKLTFAPENDYLIALFNVVDAMNHWLEYQKIFPDRFYGIRYEALKTDPEEETKKICRFLGVDYEPSMLDEDNWTEFHGNEWKKWENKTVSAFYAEGDHNNPVGRWRRIICPEDLFLCEWIGRKQMKSFGLKPEGEPVSQEVFDRVIEKVTGSELLRNCFKHWCETGKGVERYPLDPLDPKTWDRRYITNPEALGLKK